jgi:hypothetical protein
MLGSSAFAAHAHPAGVSLGYFTPQPEANASMITFSNGFSIDTRYGEPSLPERYRFVGADPSVCPLYHIIQFSGPIRQEWLKELDRKGIATFGYLPHYAVLARLDQAGVDAAKSLPEVVWVGIFQPAYKIEGELLDAKGVLKIAIALMPGEKAVRVKSLIASRGRLDGASESDFGTTIYATVDDAVVLELARMQEVIWIQLRTEPTLCNNNGQWVTQTGWRSSAPPDTSTAARRVWTKGVRGQRVILGVTDTGLNVYSPGHNAFRDSTYTYSATAVIPQHRKVVAYKVNKCNAGTAAFGEHTYHGSHVNGTVAGDDGYYGGTSYYDGMSIKARLYFVDVENGSGTFCIDNDLTELWDTVYSGRGLPDSLRPIKQTSGSWGWSSSSGTYLLQDASTDQFSWAHKDFVNLLAAGNESSTRRIRNPGIAKNVITVGALQNGTSSNAIASFSSRGPTQDGRMKPTLCDPGQGIYSCNASPSTNGYGSMDGTSMATPMMNGSVGLIRCYLKQGYYPSGAAVPSDTFGYISSALIRSLAIVSADPNVGSFVVPSNDIGWGRIDLDSVLYFTGDKRKLRLVDDTTGVSTGQYAEAAFHVDSSLVPLRIALVWTDTAAAANANPTLVNNLNLEVVAPSGTFYRGNKYTSGQSTPNPTAWDSLNPEECVRVNSPETGDWTIRVRGQQVRTARQPYAWAITGAVSAPLPPPSGDVGCTRIITPVSALDSGSSVTPACSTYNYGTVTASYLVRMKIGTGYNQTATVTNQPPATSRYVTFPSWTASPRGLNAVSCSTELASDTNHVNDRQTGSVLVNVHDVGCSHLLAPAGNVDSGSSVVPACSLYNFGTGSESYSVRMRIGSFYNQTASVSSHGAGARIYVTFPVWSVQQAPGTYTVRCSTELATDQAAGNNKATGSVQVQQPANHDVGCTRILAPVGTIDSGTVLAPACSVYNFGNRVESYNVRMRIGSNYDTIAAVTSHAAGARLMVVFPSFTASVPGILAVTCSTRLAADANPANDRQTGNVTVVVHDVGAIAIIAPFGGVDSGTVVTPQAIARNFGTVSENFKVRFLIEPAYLDSQTVNLTAGAVDTVSFADWIASPLGWLALKCTTLLAGDLNPANDFVQDSVFVSPLTGIEEGRLGLPRTFVLEEPKPNPFTQQTVIRYGLPRKAHVALGVYSATGKLLKTLVNGSQPPGYYSLPYYSLLPTPYSLPQGIYLLRAEFGTVSFTRKLVKVQ